MKIVLPQFFFQYITLFYMYFEFCIALRYVLGLTKIAVKLMHNVLFLPSALVYFYLVLAGYMSSMTMLYTIWD